MYRCDSLSSFMTNNCYIPTRAAMLMCVTFCVLQLLVVSEVASNECGIAVYNKVVGGVDSGGYHYPWFALLRLTQYRDQPVCAGSLITPHHVLSAAHCFFVLPGTPPDKLFNVALGVYDACATYEPTRDIFQVSHVEVHEMYNRKNKFYDIALMTLSRAASYTPVCLPTANLGATAVPGLLVGFGVTKQGERTPPCHMQEANITIFTQRQCSTSNLPAEDVREPSVLCAGDFSGQKDSCQGDSGGPLHSVDYQGTYFVQGIVSYGYGCGNEGYPGVYTKVFHYMDWITQRINRVNEPNNPQIIQLNTDNTNTSPSKFKVTLPGTGAPPWTTGNQVLFAGISSTHPLTEQQQPWNLWTVPSPGNQRGAVSENWVPTLPPARKPIPTARIVTLGAPVMSAGSAGSVGSAGSNGRPDVVFPGQAGNRFSGPDVVFPGPVS